MGTVWQPGSGTPLARLSAVADPDPGSTRSFDADEVHATLTSTLDSLDDAENYRNWIVDLARPHLAGPILEVGAGHGTFTESFAAFGAVTAVEAGRPRRDKSSRTGMHRTIG